MQTLIDKLDRWLRAFVDQRDDLALLLCCRGADTALVLKILEGIDEASASNFFWVFPEIFDAPEAYVTAIVEHFAGKHEVVRQGMLQAGMPPWPELPEVVRNESVPPVRRLRELMFFSRSLVPIPGGGLSVWALCPLDIGDYPTYADFVTELLRHDYPFPWCYQLRIIARDDPEQPVLGERLGATPRIDRHELDLGPEAIERSLQEEAGNEHLPLERRIQAIQLLAGLDYAHQRYPRALEKYHLILPYFVRTDNASLTALTLNSIGECHERIDDGAQAEFYFEQSLAAASESDPPPAPIALNTLLNLGNLAFQQQRWDEAEVYYTGAEQLATAQQSPRTIAQCLENRGYCQAKQRQVAAARDSWEAGAAIARDFQEQDLLASLLGRLCSLYRFTGQSERLRQTERELATLDQPVLH